MRPSRILASAMIVATFAQTSLAETYPTNACSVRKLRATAKLFACLAKGETKTLRGKDFDPARCTAKLEKSFATAEDHGPCGVVGDAAAAEAHATNALTALLTSLGAPDDNNRACLAAHIGNAGQVVTCYASFFENYIPGAELPLGGGNCDARLELSDRELEYCDGTGVVIDPSVFLGASSYLRGVEYQHRDRPPFVPGADLSFSNMSYTTFNQKDSSNVNFQNANLSHASFYLLSFAGSDFRGADMTRFSSFGLYGCPAYLPENWICAEMHAYSSNQSDGYVLLGPYVLASYLSLDPADHAGLDLAGAQFEQVNFGSSSAASNFAGASFVDADVASSTFKNIDLSNADFSGAMLFASTTFVDADLTGANWTDAYLTDVFWTSTTCPDGTSSDANGNTCCGHHVGNAPASCTP